MWRGENNKKNILQFWNKHPRAESRLVGSVHLCVGLCSIINRKLQFSSSGVFWRRRQRNAMSWHSMDDSALDSWWKKIFRKLKDILDILVVLSPLPSTSPKSNSHPVRFYSIEVSCDAISSFSEKIIFLCSRLLLAPPLPFRAHNLVLVFKLHWRNY